MYLTKYKYRDSFCGEKITIDYYLFLLLLLKQSMAKKKDLTYEEKMLDALTMLPNPLEDKKHRIHICFANNHARSNETRFEHISSYRHDLYPSDIRRIARHINKSIMKQDAERTDTYNLYIKRNNYGKEYIKISLEIDFRKSNTGIVKTIFITRNMK